MWRWLDWMVMSETEFILYLLGSFVIGFIIGLFSKRVKRPLSPKLHHQHTNDTS